ncbi:MAG: ATP:cob(I)alamin adenosyltransferase [Candidatus Yanofskybacteria bacterium RIFCSPHIGHO2_01_FULL_42_12]|uniref:Corrinoid adenosyltransferase n=1 Tax=Candidatus Yanofskybacteria bacterium RIFCSPLOWO2_01_FULL_42_49 TaxID=1802694 RepID=A0A1F8GCQ6_9BACT|nr:MAG: ATP:cob(I)alamin adenosyltransferase [Candidatus Yanofskybacteria bacterium RIFCSPHIGHO2_01_FULL_42_12]OGN23144.1 MAG: ATP:cob(I)alamin adenosyltransferase [Candidatus Yanofskybacteria bacterium RIFCSPLOWO2_01_FULL_42_49]
MPIFYTRKGDDGRSRIGKKVVSKTCLEVEALGQLDELNSMVGVLKSGKVSGILKKHLHEIQENLFIIQSHVANLMLGSKFKVPKFSAEGGSASGGERSKVEEAEKIIDEIERKLPPLKKFVISGINQTSAWLDLLRAKSRNVERKILEIRNSKLEIDASILAYINRLSSLFFALARWEANGKKEQHPKYR